MKKVLILCGFIFLFGTTFATAQNKIEINAIAAKKAEALRRTLKFNDITKEEVYQAYKSYGNAMASVKKQKHIEDYTIKKLNNELDSKMKRIFTEEQYKHYKETID